MSIKDFLLKEAAKSKYIEKIYIFDTIKIQWLLKDDADKEEAKKFIGEIQIAVKQYIPNICIESTIVDNAEKDEIKEIPYVQ